MLALSSTRRRRCKRRLLPADSPRDASGHGSRGTPRAPLGWPILHNQAGAALPAAEPGRKPKCRAGADVVFICCSVTAMLRVSCKQIPLTQGLSSPLINTINPGVQHSRRHPLQHPPHHLEYAYLWAPCDEVQHSRSYPQPPAPSQVRSALQAIFGGAWHPDEAIVPCDQRAHPPGIGIG